ncbi:alternative ribosome rescue aminoacyl-tRNA hydrolase ArfB [Pedobacter nanyangensis]|uniref:alternative ribosome rescue aminoacyl-tRNA hydrolase ArfB n=1 Tax=Pedobacter nanyangensis TaxID=1562389 RepID=UPI001F063918|nr:alternative ribosome rescue aminoacyl-tRNA hydrolase ArfB [Pedobacter nanyangensis]
MAKIILLELLNEIKATFVEMLPEQSEILKVVSFKTSRSGGKGGQHVNKVSSKVELIFDIDDADFFSEEEKRQLKEKLAARIDSEGLLHVVSQEDRSQFMNKQRAVLKLIAILKAGLQVRKARKATKIPKAVKEKRLANKAQLSQKKEGRRKLNFD